MSRETEFQARMQADSTLMSILLGGVYVSGDLGPEGITRETATAAFDGNGYLQPAALVRQRGLVPDGAVQEQETQQASAAQIVEVWLYEDRGYTSIDAALDRLFTLFYGHIFADSFPVELANIIHRQRDEGALNGASLARQDWTVYSIEE